MATVDVIIPAFNAAKYLPFALESVLSQTFRDWRILLIDDGSTDNTSVVVAPFIERLGDKIQYVQMSNGGVSAARNAAIRISNAEFIALLDADDVWLPCRLAESLQAFADDPEVGLSYGLITGIDPEGRTLDTFKGNPSHADGRIAPYIYVRKVDLPSPTITVRRRSIDEVGMFDETLRITEDRDLWLRIALRYKIAFVPKVIAYYRNSPGSLTTDPARMLRAQMQFIHKNYGQPGCGFVPRQIALARSHKQLAEMLDSRAKPAAALRSALRAVSLYPFGLDNARTATSLFLSWVRSLVRSSTTPQ